MQKQEHGSQRSHDPRLIDGVGVWLEHLTGARSGGDPILFLDRDGVIVQEVGYLRSVEDVRLVEAAPAAIRMANSLSIRTVIVTKQSGIGRGLYSWRDFEVVQEKVLGDLARAGGYVDVVAACAYHALGKGKLAHDNHMWRKPNSGMISGVAALMEANLAQSLIVGDRLSDLLAGQRAGVGRGLLVRTGYGTREATLLSPESLKPMSVEISDDIAGVKGWLSEQRRG